MTAMTAALASMLTTCTTCRSWAEQEEGPYHRDAPRCAATSSRTATAYRCASASEPAVVDIAAVERGYLAAVCLVLPPDETAATALHREANDD